MLDKEKTIYLKGYKEGFESALKMAWAYSNDLLINVNDSDKPIVEEFIKKLVH